MDPHANGFGEGWARMARAQKSECAEYIPSMTAALARRSGLTVGMYGRLHSGRQTGATPS